MLRPVPASSAARCMLLTLAVLLTVALVGTASAFAPTQAFATATARAAAPSPAPRTPRGLPTAIEPLAPYVEDVTCDLRIRQGTRKLAALLVGTYRADGATDWASTYTCGTDGTRSEHYDGRAIDWMVSVTDHAQHAAAKAFLSWLLATDRAGNRFAMARRLGVMYVIYDNRMWGAWDGRWEQYNGCAHHPQAAYANACHRTHMHISLSWDGALGRTSYWTKRVPRVTDYGPCRRPGLAWAPAYSGRNPLPCPNVSGPVLGAHASATKRALAQWSGIRLHRGMTGPAVAPVQAALGVAQTGRFDGATLHALRRFQSRRHLPRTRVMRAPTWLTLLAATR